MIERIQLVNFRAHEKLTVKLDPHVTTIVGPSDRGKSTIMGALRWLATNRPSGTEFVRWGTDRAVVRVLVDGRTITRVRGKTDNRYLIDKQEYKAVGMDVPQDVQDLLNLGPVNFQGQFDQQFWLSATAAQVSREMNAVINLDIIDDMMAYIAEGVRTSTTHSKLAQGRYDAAVAAHAALTHAPSQMAAIEMVELVYWEYHHHNAAAAALAGLCRRAAQTAARAARARQRAAQGRVVAAAGRAAGKAGQAARDLGQLVAKARTWADARTAVKQWPDLEPLHAAHKRHAETASDADTLMRLTERCRRAAASAKHRRERLRALKSQLETMTGGQCPLCGNLMTTVTK